MPKTITISDETYESIKDQLKVGEEINIDSYSDFIGKKLFIRTVTYHTVGKVEKIIGNLMQLTGASWVAESGRFMNAIKDGVLDEVEPVGITFVNINAIVDMFFWNHALPTKQK